MDHVEKVIRKLSKSQGNTMLASMSTLPPWKILISTILSARSRDETTLPIALTLYVRYPTLESLAAARQNDVEKIIKKTGFYHNKASFVIGTAQKLLSDFHGEVPRTLPAFKIPAIPVDTHVHRISNRLGVVRTKTPWQTERKLIQIIPQKYWLLYNDLLVYHGKTICKPIGPRCRECPVNDYCKKIGVDKKYYDGL
jgi:endonuclease-3